MQVLALRCLIAPSDTRSEIMTYIASPRTAKGTLERSADCYQCFSSILSAHEGRDRWQDFETELVAAAVEAGWEEDEVRAALKRFRSADEAASASSAMPDAEQKSSSEALSAQRPTDEQTEGNESARGLQESAQREERRIELQKGSPLAKGEERFEERSRSSDGKSAGEKQDPKA